jgi:hypothetical protein
MLGRQNRKIASLTSSFNVVINFDGSQSIVEEDQLESTYVLKLVWLVDVPKYTLGKKPTNLR